MSIITQRQQERIDALKLDTDLVETIKKDILSKDCDFHDMGAIALDLFLETEEECRRGGDALEELKAIKDADLTSNQYWMTFERDFKVLHTKFLTDIEKVSELTLVQRSFVCSELLANASKMNQEIASKIMVGDKPSKEKIEQVLGDLRKEVEAEARA